LEKRGPKLWVVGLIILLSVYLAFLVVGVGFWLATASVSLLTSVVVGLSVGLSVLLVCYGAYLTYEKKRGKDFLLSLTIAGVVFVVLGAIVFVPYTTGHTYGTVSSFDWTYSIFSGDNLNEHPASLNGTLIEQTLPPLSSRTYIYEGYSLPYNNSVYQIEFSYQGRINFAMTAAYYGTDYGFNGPVLNMTYEGYGPYSWWSTLLWTPPTEGVDYLIFVFTNLENQSKTFYFNMTEFFRQDSISPSVTNYRSVVNPSFAYAGLSMICVAAMISADLLPRLRTKEENVQM